jgi:outer membrane receptor protein involved in Fe transport
MRSVVSFLFLVMILAILGEATAPALAAATPSRDDDFLAESDLMFFGETMVESASKSRESALTAPAVITVIDRAEIEQRGYQTLCQLLQDIPGFFVEEDIAGCNLFLLSQKNAILVLIDGVSQAFEGNKDSFPRQYELSLDIAERVEIIRGPQSTLWGVNAFAGIVNIIPRSAEMGSFHDMTLGLGSGDLSEASLRLGQRFEAIRFFLAGSLRRLCGNPRFLENAPQSFSMAEDQGEFWLDPVDFVSAYSQNDTDWYSELYGKLEIGRSFEFSARASYFRDYLPISPFSGAYLPFGQNSRRSLPAFWGNLTWHVPLGSFVEQRAQLFLALFQNHSRIILFPEGDAATYPEGGSFRLDENFSTLGLEEEIKMQRGTWSWIVGGSFHADFSRQYADIFSPFTLAEEDASAPDSTPPARLSRRVDSQVFSLYGQGRWNITRTILVSAGSRYDRPNNFQAALNPRAGLVFSPTQLFTLKLLYGEATEFPDSYDLEDVSSQLVLSETAIENIEPNDDLKPQKIRTLQTEGQFRLGSLGHGQFAAAYSWVSDMIQESLGSDMIIRSFNAGNGQFLGLESTISLDLSDWFRPSLNYSYSRRLEFDLPDERVGGDALTLTGSPSRPPSHIAGALVTLKLARRWQLFSGLSYVSGRSYSAFSLDSSQSPERGGIEHLESYFLSQANLTMTSEDERWECSVRLRDILGQSDDIRTNNGVWPGAGREIFLHLRWRW